MCLAETPAASPASPVTETYEAACAASPAVPRVRGGGAAQRRRGHGAAADAGGTGRRAHRARPGRRVRGPAGSGCPRPPTPAPASTPARRPGSVTASGDGPCGATHRVATGRTLRRAERGALAPGHGTVAAVDAVSLAWAERFARALAPLRTDGPPGTGSTRVSAPLPQAARLLDELGLARATPASLMARWADAADDSEALGGRAWAVLGAGPRGPVGVDLRPRARIC